MEKLHWELRKLHEAVEKEFNWKPQKPLALKKVKAYLHGLEKPSRETLDRISLFVGFQDWNSFRKALHGESDGVARFEDKDSSQAVTEG